LAERTCVYSAASTGSPSIKTTTGAWFAASVNKKRDPATDVGKVMIDAATAFAVLALTHTP
jgi:hypothetical protein